jgi:uncharacterized Zn-binding protein involved in type VI secretion
MLPAARIGDPFVCQKHPIDPAPEGGGVLGPPPGQTTVLIGMMPAAREGDTAVCIVGGKECVEKGEPSVKIEGKPAARMTDPTAQSSSSPPSGKIVMGCPTVLIGSVAQASPLRRAAEHGTPFCEDCEKGGA